MAQLVPVPTRVVALEALSPVHYQDAFAVQTPTRHTPEEWVRLIFGGTPPAMRAFLRGIFKLLRFGQAPAPAMDSLPGKIVHNGPEEVVLGLDVAVGLTARIIVVNPPGQVVMTTLVRFNRARGRAVWTVLATIHRAVARYLLDRAANPTSTT
jgi:hypothetical protein